MRLLRGHGLFRKPLGLGVPVLVTAQLTKDGKRADGEDRLPSTDDLKYGGALVEAAYGVMLREYMIDPMFGVDGQVKFGEPLVKEAA